MNRMIQFRGAAIVVALVLTTFTPVARGATDKCSELSKLSLPDTTIKLAGTVLPGSFESPDGSSNANESQLFRKLPAFCRVVAILHPNQDSNFKIEIWMPPSAWNQKFKGHGNGGFAGSIDYFAMANSLAAGYATSATDTGHTGGDTDSSWALGHPEKVIDYGYRAIHEMTVKAKAIVAVYYGQTAGKSYFCSCSNGGREALVEAQRFPSDYNGIIAGASANNWTLNFTAFIWNSMALYADPASSIAPAKLPAISAGVLAACDGQEGVKDGLLNDPRRCHFDPETLLCTGKETDRCLTRTQITALKKIYAGAKNSAGQQIFPGFEPGGELGPGGWEHWLLAKPMGRQFEYGDSFFKNLVFADLNWDYRTMNFDRDTKIAGAKLAAILNSTDPNLEAFKKAGGKLILYHGWSDAAIPPQNSVEYYNSVVARMGPAAAGFIRLYMVPGMQHCVGGPGAVTFGQLDDETPDAQHNIYAALERWVETGVLPSNIVATKYENDQDRSSRILFTRPLCAYPTKPQYGGSGEANDAKNFSCRN